MEDTIWEELSKISDKEEKESLLENISEEDARRIFDRYSTRYDEALRRLS